MKLIGKTFVLLANVLFCALLFLSPALVANAASQPRPVVVVTGYGSSSAAPDTAHISLGITNKADETSAAASENAAVTAKVKAAVIALGIGNSDIQTNHYYCYPEYDNNGNIIGYRISHTLSITARDFNVINQVIDNALKAGATEITGLSFSISDTANLRRIAIASAIANAKEKAEIIASTLGKRITGIQTITENSSETPRRHGNAMILKAASDTRIEAGELDYDASVTIHYYID